MNNQPSDQITSLFEDRLRSAASSEQIAEFAAVLCRGVEAALAPTIGQRGVAALFNRSLHLTARTHSWITGAIDGNRSELNIENLQSALARQTSAGAAAGGRLFLKTFNDLLMNLIGASLTERLLRSVSATPLSGTSAQDITP